MQAKNILPPLIPFVVLTLAVLSCLLRTSTAICRAIVDSRGGHIKLDRSIDLPAERDHNLRISLALSHEMAVLLAAMEEE